MLRKRSILICLTTVTFSLPGIALGKAVKQDSVCLDLESEADGFAVLNYAKGADKTNINVHGRNLEAAEQYTVFLSTWDYLECEPVGSFTSKENGQGGLHVSHPGDASTLCVAVLKGEFPADTTYHIMANGTLVVVPKSPKCGPEEYDLDPAWCMFPD